MGFWAGMTTRGQAALACWILAILTGCAHRPVTKDADPQALLRDACGPGRQVESISGSVWLKAKSKEASGQFPAAVEAKDPAQLRMEVTNLIGGTEAVITVKNDRYEVKSPKKSVREEKGERAWGGIPLRWATELFLGRIPCPSSSRPGDWDTRVDDEGRLEATHAKEKDRGERFLYSFRSWEGRPWAEALLWEKKGGGDPISVEFRFDDPEDKTRSPRKWEAKSPLGEVKVRWRDRAVSYLGAR